MAKHYSTPAFFRAMPNALLARYFAGRQLLLAFDFASLKEGNPAPLLQAWLDLPEDRRAEMETEFQEVFSLSSEKGTKAIIDEALWHLKDNSNAFVEWLSSLSNHYERAFLTFLDYPQLWRGATRFFHADTLSHWRKRKNLPKVAAQCDDANLEALAQAIGTYFHLTEGRGRNCVVEPFRRGQLDYFFAYPEDYSQRTIEWIGNEFGARPHNPALEIIFVYAEQEGTLDLHYKGNRKAIEPLQHFFAQTILQQENLAPDPSDKRIYDLDPLLDRDFQFQYSFRDGIDNVYLRKLRLSSKYRQGDRLTLEADSEMDPLAVYHLLDRLAKAIAIDQFHVTMVELVAIVAVGPEDKLKKIPIRITHPNSCSLKYDAMDWVLREMLVRSDIEPRDPEDDDRG